MRISIFALSTVALAACSSDGGTVPQPATPTPTTLVVVSGGNQTGTVNQPLTNSLVVQVNDQSGSPMANVAVGFAVTQGGGQVADASVTTGSDGRGSTTWTLGTTVGTNHQVTATVTSATSVTGAFGATALADAPSALAETAGNNQTGPTGGTLQDPVVATLQDQFGNGVAGEMVDFVVAAGNGTVNPASAITDANGEASTTWTLENAVGQQTLEVQAPGSPSITPIQFTATAVTLFLSTVSPDPLVEGQAATLTGTGFDPTPANNTVTVGGATATVTAAAATQLDIVVPTLNCQPAQDQNVIVTVASISTNTVAQRLNPASFLAVGVGQQLLITDPASFCLQFAASAANEAYLIGVQSISEVASGLTDVQLVAAKDPAAPAPPPATLTRLTAQGFPQDLVITDRMRRWNAHREAHASFQSRQLAWLNRLGTGLQMASGAGAIPPVIVGDMVSINVPNFSNLCLNPTVITAVVKHIGAKGVWLEDVANPAGGFTAANYLSLSNQLDNPIFDTDVAEFGNPTDLDANGKIGIVVTQEVNKASASLLGFVSSGDLVPVASCAASNVAELYYAKAPDPGASVGAAYSVADALDDAPGLIAHEFVHIIQFGVRFTAGAPFLSQWEAEGQATLGEEVVGHEMEGNSSGQNYGNVVAIDAGPVTGITWYDGAFFDMAQYFGWNSSVAGGLTKVSNAPQQCTWLDINAVSDGSDPNRPCMGGRQPYGVPWSFLRWLNDHFGANFTGGEQDLQRAIVSGSSSGFANISTVIGEPISTLLAQWAAALYVDDRVGVAATRLTMPSWNLFDIYEVRLPQGLRLAPAEVSFADFTQTFKVRGASTGYFRISGTTRPATAVRARDLADGTLPSSTQFWVVRLQ